MKSLSHTCRGISRRRSVRSASCRRVSLQALPQQQPDGGADQAGLDPSILGAVAQIPPRRVFQRGAISLQWQAEDKNGDTIEYSVYYRDASGAGGDFYPLKAGLRDNYYTVDPNALPDGRYVFKIVASDEASNPSAQSLLDEQETEPIELDNTPPAVAADAALERPERRDSFPRRRRDFDHSPRGIPD